MGFCFVTTEKIKDSATMVRKYEHNYRVETVPNAIPELKQDNEELVKLMDANGKHTTYLDAYKERINSLEYYKTHRVRKDNVRAYEVITTFSHEDKDKVDLEQWKADNVAWLRSYFNRQPEKYGDNVLSVMYHADEHGCVHCHAFVIPIDENGKLNARSFTGGRAAMRQMQDSYAKAMKSHNLDRGIKGSSAKHQDIKKFYTKLNQQVNVPQPEKDESAQDYHDRILSMISEERASMLHEFLQKETRSRQKFDLERQRGINAAIGTAHAERSILETEIKRLSAEKEKLEDEVKDLEKGRAELKAEYNGLIERTKHLTEMSDKIETVKNYADAYELQQEILSFARQQMPAEAKQFEECMDAMEQGFREAEKDR